MTLLQDLKRAGVKVWADKKKLHYSAEDGITIQQLEQMRDGKAELLAELACPPPPNTSISPPPPAGDPLADALQQHGTVKAAVKHWVTTMAGRDLVVELPGKDRDGKPRTVRCCTTPASLEASKKRGDVMLSPLELVTLLEARAAGLAVPVDAVVVIKDVFEGGALLAGVEGW